MIARCASFCLALWLACPAISHAKTICLFEGHSDFAHKEFTLYLDLGEKGSINAQVMSTTESNYQLSAHVKHLKTAEFDISTELEGTIEIIGDGENAQRFVRGTITSQYSLINHKPVNELSGHFKIKDRRFHINGLAWEDLRCDGTIDLFAPWKIDLHVALDKMRLQDLSLLLGCPSEDTKLSGLISGKVDLSGFLDRLLLSGRLVSYDGIIEEIAYNSLNVYFKGLYPSVRISESSVTQTDGLSYRLEGFFDFLGGCDLGESMATLKTLPIVDEDYMGREWTIKRKQEEGRSGKTEFKYQLKKSKDDSALGEDGLLGVEHRIEF